MHNTFLRPLALAKTLVVVTGQCIGPLMSLGEGKRPFPPPESGSGGEDDARRNGVVFSMPDTCERRHWRPDCCSAEAAADSDPETGGRRPLRPGAAG